MKSMSPLAAGFNRQAQLRCAREMGRFVEQAAQSGTAAHEVEQALFRKMMEMGRVLFGVFLRLNGDGDEGERVRLPDGRELRRLPKPHTRSYLTVFGEFKLERVVYGTREGQKIEHVPLDQRLRLPESKFSYLLQDWDQSLVVESPYAEVNTTHGADSRPEPIGAQPRAQQPSAQ